MSTYDRANNLPEEVKSLQDNLNELKQVQIIGNDNLRVYNFRDGIDGQTLTASVNAIFKFTFTFDEPSTSYVLPRFSVNNQPSSFNATFYADPATVNSTTSKSWFYSITTTDTVTNVIIAINMQCLDSGVATIVRIV